MLDEADKQGLALIVEKTFKAPPGRVWKALTDEAQLRQWYFNVSAFKPEVGFEFHFKGEKDGVCYLHLCKVTEVVVGKKLAYSWRYEGFAGNSVVTFELFSEGDKTRLKVTHRGLETLPPSKPDFLNGFYIPAWATTLEDSLRQFVEK
jgi:uncharacterized protein YndB with AHSA1/START domain